MKWYEVAWMIGFGILCGGLMLHEHVFNGIVILPLLPLIIRGVEKATSC